ncbi:MAG: ABC transporter ATP-binding protein [Candidatus Bathyarchaeum sp.]|nr:MAG: ABC transporter ATP-binding protein [Candidatus Bathyarchaeum sp.]
MSKQTVIQVDSLVKKYKDTTAVDGVSFTVNKGEVFSFVGPNGAGKTTTVEILVCLRNLTAGKATVLGYDVSTRKGQQQIRKRVGVLPQDFSTFDMLTVKENINYYKKMYDRGQDVDELIKLVNLEHKTKALYKNLSGGLKKRVAIAITLVNDPDVVFLDEPTTGLDPKARRDLWNLIEGLRNQGKTIFLTTHYMDEAEVLSDRVVIISYGKIIANGTPSELILEHGGKTTLIVEEGGKDAYSVLKAKFPKAHLDNGDVLVPLNDKSDLPEAVMALNDAKTKFAELVVRRPNLEDVFLNLTGKKMVDGELN